MKWAKREILQLGNGRTFHFPYIINTEGSIMHRGPKGNMLELHLGNVVPIPEISPDEWIDLKWPEARAWAEIII